MIVRQIWTANSYRNFNYLIACPETGEALAIAAHGLQRRARLSPAGIDERMFLDALLQIVDANQTPAERKLELFHGEWNGDIDPVFQEFAY